MKIITNDPVMLEIDDDFEMLLDRYDDGSCIFIIDCHWYSVKKESLKEFIIAYDEDSDVKE